MEENRKKALVAALGQIEKQFGKGSVMRLGDAASTYDIEAISTGSLGLDIALGVGGLPKGRVIEIYGPESSGKTTLTLQVIPRRNARADGGVVDANMRDLSYAEKRGVNVKIGWVATDTAKKRRTTDRLVRSCAVAWWWSDSVRRGRQAEIEGEMATAHGLRRLLSQALRKSPAN